MRTSTTTTLRRDPVLALFSDQLEPKRKDCATLAGKSTINRLKHAPGRLATATTRSATTRRLRHRRGQEGAHLGQGDEIRLRSAPRYLGRLRGDGVLRTARRGGAEQGAA